MFRLSPQYVAHATFYGDRTASETMDKPSWNVSLAEGFSMSKADLKLDFGFGSCRRSMRPRKLVPERLWNEHCSDELDPVHEQVRLHAVLSDKVRAFALMLRREPIYDGHDHQPLPAKLGQGCQQWRLVQRFIGPFQYG